MQRHAGKLALTTSLLTLVVLLGGTNPASTPLALGHSKEGESSDNSGPRQLGERIAGTYLIKFDTEDEDPTALRIVTLTADRNWFSVDAHGHEFGFTTQQGVWKKTGRREITATVLDFEYDPFGLNKPTGVSTLHFVMTFTSDFHEVSGEFSGKSFVLDEDLFDPEDVQRTFGPTLFTGQRVTVEDEDRDDDKDKDDD